MQDRTRRERSTNLKRVIVFTLAWLGVAIALFVLPLTPASAATTSITQTTVADFNKGSFYHTGLTSNTGGGGDGDGEVRLLTVGISCGTWNPPNGSTTANTTGLAGLFGHAAVQKNGFIYVSGGQTGGLFEVTALVSKTQIIPTTHNLANWTAVNSLPAPRKFHAMVAANNFLYVIGGLGATLTTTNTVLVAAINSNGSLGSWVSTTPIPTPLSDLTSVVVSDTIYVIGGEGSTVTSTVLYATPNPSTGAITAWNTASASLPISVSLHASAVYSNTIYNAGGADFSHNNFYPDVNYAIPTGLGNITTVISTTPLQNNLVRGSGTAFAGQLYIAGGAAQNASVLTKTIASSLIDITGTLSSGWTNSDCLSTARQRAASVMSDDGWLYVIEGNDGTISGVTYSIDYGPTSSPSGHYTTNGNFQSSIIDLGVGGHPISMDWNAFVSTTVTMTLQYRMGNNSNLSDGTWSSTSYATRNNLTAQTNNVPIGTVSDPSKRYIQYRVALGTDNDTQTPALNWVRVNYDVPYIPDFAITGLSAPAELGIQVTQTITYWVKDGNSTAAPIRLAPNPAPIPQVLPKSTGGPKFPPPPPSTRSSPGKVTAPSTDPPSAYLFYISFYAFGTSNVITPTTPISVTGAMTCNDYNNPQHPAGTWLPFIYWNPNPPYSSELTSVPKAFYAQCSVPASTKKFWAQIDTCLNSDGWCNPYGYVLEQDENVQPPSYADNIIGPVSAGQCQNCGNGFLFLPLIRR